MALIIIDFDDTLIDNTNLDLDSFHYIIKKNHLKKIKDDKIIRWRKNGMLARNILRRLITKKSNTLENSVKDRLEYLRRGGRGVSLITLHKGVRETLKKLKEMDYFIVIVTSREDKSMVKKTIQFLKISHFIDKIYCNSDFKKTKKRNPRDYVELKTYLYQLSLRENHSKIGEKKVLVVGNLKADIIAAKNLKLDSVAIKGSYRFDSGISKMTSVIGNFNSILNYL